MELLTPDISLIIWTILSLFALGLIIYAVIHLAYNQNVQPSQKLLWLILVIFVPVFGAIIYLGSYKKKKAGTSV